MGTPTRIVLLVWLACTLGMLIGASLLIRDTRQQIEDLRASFRTLGSSIDNLERATAELQEAAGQ